MGVGIFHIGDGELNGYGKLIMADGFFMCPTLPILREISNLILEEWLFAAAKSTDLMPITLTLDKLGVELTVCIPPSNRLLAKNDDIFNHEVLGVCASQALLHIFACIFVAAKCQDCCKKFSMWLDETLPLQVAGKPHWGPYQITWTMHAWKS